MHAQQERPSLRGGLVNIATAIGGTVRIEVQAA